MTNTRLPLLSALFAAVALSACGGGSDTTATPSPSPAPSPAPAPSPSPSPAPAPSAGSAGDCFNLVYATEGTTWKLDYQISGAATGSSSSESVVKPRTSFAGTNNLIEIAQTITTSYSAPPTLAAAGTVTATNSIFEDVDGTDFIFYGSRQTATAAGATITTTNVISPPVRDRQYSLGLNESFTVTQNTTTSISGLGVPVPDQNTAITYTITYRGQESITVPAGTFNTCKFERSDANGTSTNWIAKTSGTPVRSLSADGNGVQTVLELLASSRVNGAPVPTN